MTGMKGLVTVALAFLAVGIMAQPSMTGQFTKSADGKSSSGTVTVSGLQVNPCDTTSFAFGPNVPNNLADVNNNIVLTLSYTYQAKSSSEIIISDGIPMGLTLMNAGKPAANLNTVTFNPTTGSANSVTVTIASATKFDSITLSKQSLVNEVEKCDPKQVSAPGITGYTNINLQITISVGSPGTTTTTTTTNSDSTQGAVLAYSNGKLQGGFQDFPWGKRTYTYDATNIDWTPCEYIGLTFYNTAKKYWIKSVTGVRLTLQSDVDLTVQLRLHDVGVDRDVFTSLVQVTATKSFQTITIPISGVASTVKFDQILIAENYGASCAANPPHVFVQEVALVGTADLPTQYVVSVNGVEQTGDSATGSQSGKTSKKSSATGVSLFYSTVIVHIMAFLGMFIVI